VPKQPSRVKRAPWAVVNPEDLSISLVTKPPEGKLAIPMDRVTFRDERAFEYSELFGRVHFGTVYSLHAETLPPDNRMHFKLFEPDPWMVSTAMIVWEGLLQGLAWDVVKAAARKALDVLREKGLAPAGQVTTKRKTKSGTLTVGFHYERYSEEKGLERFLLGLRQSYELSNELERIRAARPEEYERLRQEHFKKEQQ
jgi:hypothetical protein